MTGMTSQWIDQLFDSCAASLGTLQDSLGAYLGREIRLEVGRRLAWSELAGRSALQGPGLVLAFEVAEQGLFCLIPASASLPEGFDDDGEMAANQRAALAMEWSLAMVPKTFEVTRTEALGTSDLAHEVAASNPAPSAQALALTLTSGDSDETVSELYLLAPLLNPPFPLVDVPVDFDLADSALEPYPRQQQSTERWLSALGKLPVDVIVELAGKKIDLGQMLELSPGSLITFDKPCEDLLNMYVNNRLCCRGEAVKIGEKFGLKINEVGIHKKQPQTVIEH